MGRCWCGVDHGHRGKLCTFCGHLVEDTGYGWTVVTLGGGSISTDLCETCVRQLADDLAAHVNKLALKVDGANDGR
jgi:hypothetical protein